ncbi:MAG: T9SS C-terminal target domain-containing protein [Bacteroidetes bacterium]|nr:MAG: T9SS C-terminal target domain-containing protein [Bacteroidota bacterium]
MRISSFRKYLLGFGLCLFVGLPGLQAQYPESTQTSLLTSNQTIRALCDWVSPYGWLKLKPESKIRPEAFFTNYARDMGLGPYDQMKLEDHWVDGSGTHHWRYQQYHRGLLVEGGEYSLHGQPDQLALAHGKIIEGLTTPTAIRLSEAEALRRALASLGERQYAWESPEWEMALQADQNDPAATHYPRGQLTMAFIGGSQLSASQYRPAWAFRIRSLVPDALETVYIDAETGALQLVRSPQRHCQSHTGTAHTLHHAYRSLELRRRGAPFSDYILRDCRGLTGLHTKKHQRNSFGATRGWGWIPQVSYASSSWQDHERDASTAHWAAQQAWDYFAATFGREGTDGQGRGLRIFTNWTDENGSPIPDAMFEPGSGQADYLYLGRLEGQSLALPEVVGHEYTHGIVAATAGLAYEYESGALEESFADIFGILIEQYAEQAATPDWLIGEDVTVLRSLVEPGAYGQATTYGNQDPFWVPPGTHSCQESTGNQSPHHSDFCGLHINSGVQNHWFYLLAMGHEDEDRPVLGIGLEAAARITYRNLTVYMQSRSNYQDARLGAIQAAIDLYGACSNEVAQVKNAWAAVGVGLPNDQLCAEIEGPSSICTYFPDMSYSFRVQSLEGATILWDPLPDEWVYSFSGTGNEWLTLSYVGDTLGSFDLGATVSYGGLTQRSLMTLKVEACTDTPPDQPPANRSEYPQFSLFPNPARGRIMVRLPRRLYPATLDVLDLQGRLVHSEDALSASHRLSLLGIAPGYYLLRVRTDYSVEVKPFEVLD